MIMCGVFRLMEVSDVTRSSLRTNSIEAAATNAVDGKNRSGERSHAPVQGRRLPTAQMALNQVDAQSVSGRHGLPREAMPRGDAITPDGKTRNVHVAPKRR